MFLKRRSYEARYEQVARRSKEDAIEGESTFLINLCKSKKIALITTRLVIELLTKSTGLVNFQRVQAKH